LAVVVYELHVCLSVCLFSGGVYVIEDLLTSYYRTYGGGPPASRGTTIEVIKSALDSLNKDFAQDWIPEHADFIVDTGKFSAFAGDQDLASVHCFRSMCALRKRRGGEFLEAVPGGCSQKGTLPTLSSKVPCAAPGWV
jgi:hypothetical protein